MKVCIVGLGYIGLPTAAMFSNYGHEVIGVDIKPEIVNTLNEGQIHIEEPGLAELIQKSVTNKTFKASLDVETAEAYIIAVPTPNLDDAYMSCDLTYVLEACERILPYVNKGNIIIVESTIAPRTMEDHIVPIFEKAGWKVGEEIFLAHCPERVLPGKVLHELVHNNRIIGGVTEQCSLQAAKVYELFVEGELILTEAKTAEMSKCMENTFRDVNIALANELVKICVDLNINALDVIKYANKHPRVNLHLPGPGVGGHCLAVDPYFIYAKSPEYAKLIKMSRDINNSMPSFVVDLVNKLLNYNTASKIAVFGLTYKGNIDDIRESPAIEIVELLEKLQYKVAKYDPHVNIPSIVSFDEAVENADLILVLTDHAEFKALDFAKITASMNNPLILDTKNIVQDEASNDATLLNFGNVSHYLNTINLLSR